MTYQVYRATGKHTAFVYYGYCAGDADALLTFLTHAAKRHSDGKLRGAAELLKDNNDEVSSIDVEVVEIGETDHDAWELRNEYRSQDDLSITPPTYWPGNFAAKSSEKSPEQVLMWRTREMVRQCKTAYEAYTKFKAFKYAEIKQLGEIHGNQLILEQMRTLNPVEFKQKYSLELHFDTAKKAA